jgi:hypothetical protein
MTQIRTKTRVSFEDLEAYDVENTDGCRLIGRTI